jgi:hypothetical protein
MITETLRPSVGRPVPREGAAGSALANGPWTMEERLRCIADMGRRIDGYVQFICQVGSLNGTSTEAKEKAVAAFFEQMTVLERQLGGIQEGLRLG